MQQENNHKSTDRGGQEQNNGETHEFFLTLDQHAYIQHHLPKGYSLVSERERRVLKKNFEPFKDTEDNIFNSNYDTKEKRIRKRKIDKFYE